MIFIDPTGQGAEVSARRDKNGKVEAIDIKAKVYVHGQDAAKAVEAIKKDIEDHLKNNQNLTGTWGGSKNVPVIFDISVEEVDDDQLEQKKKEHTVDQSINIVEMKSESGYLGQGKFDISLDHMINRGNTFSHEFLHMLGFNSGEKDDPTHYSQYEEGELVPMMYSGPGGTSVLKPRTLTTRDVMGLRNRQGFNFTVSPKRRSSTKVIEYPNPVENSRYVGGEIFR